jgi:hypothetical protein
VKFVNLDDEIYELNLSLFAKTTHSKRSDLHTKTRALIKELFPNVPIIEELTIKLCKKKVVYADFFLPMFKIAVEVNGEQHFKYIPHFHGPLINFYLQKKNDNDKREWFSRNNIQWVDLNYNEDINEWRTKLRSIGKQTPESSGIT